MESPPNAIERSILDLTRRGSCARIVVDATREGVEVPDFVREQWGNRLVIDLNPAWPIDLAFDEQALYADLGFQGVLMRCRIPFRAVWAVADRAKGAGFVFHAHVPEEHRAEIARSETDAPPPEALREVEPPTKPAAAPRRASAHLKLVKSAKRE